MWLAEPSEAALAWLPLLGVGHARKEAEASPRLPRLHRQRWGGGEAVHQSTRQGAKRMPASRAVANPETLLSSLPSFLPPTSLSLLPV